MTIGLQLAWLLILAIPLACIAWTVTHEEVFREPRNYCQEQSQHAPSLPRRKFLYPGWRGYLISLFALVWVANQYMSIYNHLRLDIKHEQVEIRAKEKEDVVRQRKAA